VSSGAGRPPKPTALHRLHNTGRARTRSRRRQEPQPAGDLNAAPDWFNETQRASWDYAISNCPAGLLKLLDRGVLVLWCEAEDRHRLATMTQNELNRRNGAPFLVKSPLGMVMSPYVEVIDRAAKTMFKAESEMGFSPASRPRIKVATPAGADATADDPWRALRVIPGGKPE
jgi:P27 family predicted phage terminase small subunit